MPPPFVSFVPGAKFAFPRSYYYQIYCEDQSPNISRFLDYIHVDIDPTIGYGIWYKIRPQFWNWSSNRYTLDFVLEDVWWEANFDGVHHPQAAVVQFGSRGNPPIASLIISNPFIQTDFVALDVQQAPPTYWTPTPL